MKLRELFAALGRTLSGNRAIIHGIKYIPLLCTALYTLHVLFLLFGVNEPVTVSLAIILMTVMLVLLSIKFHFCKLHKIMLLFMCVMTVCICIQKLDGFGDILLFVRLALLATGTILVTKAIIDRDDDECDK